MKRRRWFLPDSPDVLGLLRGQLAVTIEGIDAFQAWTEGDPAAAERVREREHAGDTAKRELLGALRSSPRTRSRSRAASTGCSTPPATSSTSPRR